MIIPIPIEKIEKYKDEILQLISQLDEREQKEKKVKELTEQLKDTLCQLDKLCVCVTIECDECGKYIDITDRYKELLVNQW